MADRYGSDFITIADEDGTEFELEVLTTIEYNGSTYLAVTLAGNEDEESYQVDILKNMKKILKFSAWIKLKKMKL